MNKLQQFEFLKIFGDGNPHNWYEVIYLGVISLKMHQRDFEKKIFKKALDYHLIRRVENDVVRKSLVSKENHKSGIWVGLSWQDYDYKITEKGDKCLRSEQIARDGDQSYYKYFDRTIDGAHGLNKYAPVNFNKAKNQ